MRGRGSARTAVLALVASVGLLAGPVAAGAAPRAGAPQLSIAIDDGVATAESGDVLDYTIRVTNQGPATVRALRISQSLPEGARLLSASGAADRSATLAQWGTTLDAGEQVVLHSTAEVGTMPATVLRLASVACARATPKAPPVVCATDSDLLPAGAKAAASSAAARTASGDSGEPGRAGWYAAIATGLFLLAAGGFVALRRRRAGSSAGPPVTGLSAKPVDRPDA